MDLKLTILMPEDNALFPGLAEVCASQLSAEDRKIFTPQKLQDCFQAAAEKIGSTLFVLSQKEKPVGYILFTPLKEKEKQALFHPQTANVLLCVHKDFEKQGIAAELIQQAYPYMAEEFKALRFEFNQNSELGKFLQNRHIQLLKTPCSKSLDFFYPMFKSVSKAQVVQVGYTRYDQLMRNTIDRQTRMLKKAFGHERSV